MKTAKAKEIELGGRYTKTYQQIEWVCSFCGAENTHDQDMIQPEHLIDPLLVNCGVCCVLHEIPKSILNLKE